MAEKKAGKQNTKTKSRQTKKKLVIVESPTKVESITKYLGSGYDIEATIYCLRNSHKGIIIGKDGKMLKRIGQSARIDMEKNFGTRVNLKTWVKVKEDWQDDSTIIKKFKLQ